MLKVSEVTRNRQNILESYQSKEVTKHNEHKLLPSALRRSGFLHNAPAAQPRLLTDHGVINSAIGRGGGCGHGGTLLLQCTVEMKGMMNISVIPKKCEVKREKVVELLQLRDRDTANRTEIRAKALTKARYLTKSNTFSSLSSSASFSTSTARMPSTLRLAVAQEASALPLCPATEPSMLWYIENVTEIRT